MAWLVGAAAVSLGTRKGSEPTLFPCFQLHRKHVEALDGALAGISGAKQPTFIERYAWLWIWRARVGVTLQVAVATCEHMRGVLLACLRRHAFAVQSCVRGCVCESLCVFA